MNNSNKLVSELGHLIDMDNENMRREMLEIEQKKQELQQLQQQIQNQQRQNLIQHDQRVQNNNRAMLMTSGQNYINVTSGNCNNNKALQTFGGDLSGSDIADNSVYYNNEEKANLPRCIVYQISNVVVAFSRKIDGYYTKMTLKCIGGYSFVKQRYFMVDEGIKKISEVGCFCDKIRRGCECDSLDFDWIDPMQVDEYTPGYGPEFSISAGKSITTRLQEHPENKRQLIGSFVTYQLRIFDRVYLNNNVLPWKYIVYNDIYSRYVDPEVVKTQDELMPISKFFYGMPTIVLSIVRKTFDESFNHCHKQIVALAANKSVNVGYDDGQQKKIERTISDLTPSRLFSFLAMCEHRGGEDMALLANKVGEKLIPICVKQRTTNEFDRIAKLRFQETIDNASGEIDDSVQSRGPKMISKKLLSMNQLKRKKHAQSSIAMPSLSSDDEDEEMETVDLDSK